MHPLDPYPGSAFAFDLDMGRNVAGWGSQMVKQITVLGVSVQLLWAQCDYRQNLPDLYYRDLAAQAPHVSMIVCGDYYPDASNQTPNYARIRLVQGVRLAETLVDLESDGTEKTPIYLAMILSGAQNGETLVAAPDTVSIVRWRAGEREFWIKVTGSSSSWIRNQLGELVAPSGDLRVYWTWGPSARSTWNASQSYTSGGANLPGNTRWPELMIDPGQDSRGWAVSTLYCLDLSGSSLQPWPHPSSEVNLDVAFFDHQTSGVTTAGTPSQITLGTPLPSAMFPLDHTIARTIDAWCLPTLDAQISFLDSPLRCSGSGTSTPDLIASEFHIDGSMACAEGWGTFLELALPAQPDVFFLVETDAGGQPLVAFQGPDEVLYRVDGFSTSGAVEPLATASDVVFQAGHWVTHRVRLTAFTELGLDDLTVVGRTFATANGPSVQMAMSSRLVPSWRRDPIDDAPFDGTVDDGNPFTGVTQWDQSTACWELPGVSNFGPSAQVQYLGCVEAVPTMERVGTIALIVGLLMAVIWFRKVHGSN